MWKTIVKQRNKNNKRQNVQFTYDVITCLVITSRIMLRSNGGQKSAGPELTQQLGQLLLETMQIRISR